MLTAHPHREALHNEVHARPYEQLTAPLMLSHVALVGEADAAREHIASLLRNRPLPLPAEDANHLSVDLGGMHLRWEKHTEFHTCTFWKRLHDAPESFDAPALADVSQEWLSAMPGQWIVGMHVMVRCDNGVDARSRVHQLVRRCMQEENLLGSNVMDHDAEVYTDLQLAADGVERFIVVANGMSPRRLGRAVQRLLEIETYRMMALMGLPMAAPCVGALQSPTAATVSTGLQWRADNAPNSFTRYAMTHSFQWSVGYPSQRLPVFGRNLVATSHPLAAQAGLRMMQKGGNAVDAAIAAAAVMTIVEPVSNGLGSDAFCILWDGSQLHGLNSCGRAPEAWTAQYFKRKYGDAASNPPKRGWDSVTVPGMVSGWVALSERFGRLPFSDLFEPAIDVAERGYAVPVVVQQKWAAAAKELFGELGFAEAFLPNGRAPNVAELFRFRSAARTLRLVAQTKGEAYYRGEIAEAVVRHAHQHGAVISTRDFARHEPEWVTPLAKRYRDHTLHEIPPSGQGIAAQMALGILQNFDLASLPIDSAGSQHLQIEAMKLAFADVYRYVAESTSMEVSVDAMLDDAYLASRARLIDAKRAQDFGAGNPVKGGTIYLTTADERGMMVSLIQSNYMGFGSGVVVPGYGLSMQNRGHGFSLDPASPNVVAPGKRPFHTIIPAFLTKNGEPVMSFGVMGANMQPQGHVQTLVRMLDHRQHPQAACDAPRWRFNQGLSINAESSMNHRTLQGLIERGHRVEVLNDSYQDFGAGQFIWRLGDPAVEGYMAASDPRRDGQAVVF